MKQENLLFTEEGILLSENSKIRMLAYKDIVCFITDRPYVIIGTNNQKLIFIQASMSLIATFVPSCFCMCSQSAIINLVHVDVYKECRQVFLVYLKNGHVVNVSRRCRNNLKNQIVLFKKMMNAVTVG